MWPLAVLHCEPGESRQVSGLPSSLLRSGLASLWALRAPPPPPAIQAEAFVPAFMHVCLTTCGGSKSRPPPSLTPRSADPPAPAQSISHFCHHQTSPTYGRELMSHRRWLGFGNITRQRAEAALARSPRPAQGASCPSHSPSGVCVWLCRGRRVWYVPSKRVSPVSVSSSRSFISRRR